ncbi:MAG: TRAP transporter small permease subunit [Alphaproteobacteria bacterium]|nr:MAG: TRAP transporter small permease subunit [Alphaproteobacteria bacterium]
MTRLIGGLDRLVAAILSAGSWLLLPVVLLLFLQWPLRDIARAYSREANDLGQWLFALYIAMAFTAATRAHTHLAADALARHYPARTRVGLARLGALFGLIPWALFIIVGGANLVIVSLRSLEAFADTYNPGYFFIKLALWLLAGLVLMQAIVDIARPRREGH